MTTINVTDEERIPKFQVKDWVRLVKDLHIMGHKGRFIVGDRGYVAIVFPSPPVSKPLRSQAYEVIFSYPKIPEADGKTYREINVVVSESELELA